MKNKINIFLNKNIKLFFTELLSDYDLFFMNLNDIEKNFDSINTNIILINDIESIKLINLKKISDNFIILSNLKNINLNTNNKFIKIPAPINHIKNTIENFMENFKIKFHDITITNEKVVNIKNNKSCYLTKLESEILSHLITEKECSKKFIQENILNIKSTIQTNSLDSHLTRIRKKMNQIKTSIKIQSKSEKLLIII